VTSYASNPVFNLREDRREELFLVEWVYDYGRFGSIDGLFFATGAALEDLKSACARKAEIYLGEALGKHSEIIITLDESQFELKADGADAATVFRILHGTNSDITTWTLSGFSPFDYALEEE